MSKFRVILNAWLLALILFCVVAVPIFAAYSDCAYYLTVTVSNNSSTAYPNLRVVYDVNPASLVAGGYMQVDADDIYLTSSSSVLYSTALNMTGDGVHWLGVVNAPAHSNQQLRLYTGWVAAAGRNQTWCANSGDVGTVADSASLDITTNLTLETLVNSTNTTGVSTIWDKGDAYWLRVSGGRYYFGALSGTASGTENLRPDGVGNGTGIDSVSGAATHWEAVDEAVADDATTYVEEASGGTDYYTLGATSIPADSVISSVTVYYRFRCDTGGGFVYAQGGVQLGGVDVWGAADSVAGTTWTNHNSGALARPGGGSWAISDLNSLSVGLYLYDATGGVSIQCTQVYVSVAYYPSIEVSLPVTISTWQTVKGTYNGTAVGLYLDGTLGNTSALAGNLYDGGAATCLEFDGLIDLLRIGSTNMEAPIWVATYQFESTQANSGQIMDQSGNGNTITYTLAGMPSGTGTAVGPLVTITLYISTPTGGNASVGEPAVIPPFGIPLYENTTATGSNLIGYDIFLRGASSLGWSSATLYSVMFMEAAIAFGFAATIGTGTLFFGALAGMGLLTLGAATGLLAWWIPLILGLLTVMAITVFKEL